MKNNYPAIVVIGYNRPKSLTRLLTALANAEYPQKEIPLLISLDGEGGTDCEEIAQAYDWTFGQKNVIVHKKHLGLKEHILRCGDLSEKYGSVILLEDDILISPQFYQFALSAKDYCRNDSKIAGISLYSYAFAESCFAPFEAIDDGSDVYFMQLTSSWGELFTQKQWFLFRKWLNEHPAPCLDCLPQFVAKWSEHSWKKRHIEYLITKGLYFVYPRKSLSTNFGDPGVNDDRKGFFQVNLQLRIKDYRFVDFNESYSIYDSSFELLPESFQKLAPERDFSDCEIDLYGTKNPEKTNRAFMLTTQFSSGIIDSFGLMMWPAPLNVIHKVDGTEIKLSRTKDVQPRQTNILSKHYRLDSIKPIYTNEYTPYPVDEEAEAVKHSPFYPVISIVVVNYNLAKYLDEALYSIVSQQYPKLELIVIDGASTDNSVEIIKKYEEYITYWVSESDTGQYHAIQKGFEQATGDIMAWLNSDDKYHGKALLAVAKIFMDFPNISWIMGLPTEYNDEGITSTRITLPWARWSKYRYYTYDFQFIQQESTFWRKSLWEKAGANVSTAYHVAGDMDLWARFFRHAKLHTALVLVGGFRYRKDENQKSRKHVDRYMEEANEILKREVALLSAREKIKVAILKLLRFPLGIFFFLDIPYLRWFYERWFEIPETVQLDLSNKGSFIFGKWLVKHPPVYWRKKQISIKK